MKPHDIKMQAAVRDTYEQMDRSEIPYEDGITKLGRIADEHIAACKADLNKTMSTR